MRFHREQRHCVWHRGCVSAPRGFRTHVRDYYQRTSAVYIIWLITSLCSNYNAAGTHSDPCLCIIYIRFPLSISRFLSPSPSPKQALFPLLSLQLAVLSFFIRCQPAVTLPHKMSGKQHQNMRQAYYKRESSFLLEGRPKTMLFIHSGSYSGTGKWGKANLLITTKEDFITMQSRCKVNGPLEVVNGAPGPLQIEAALRGEIEPETFVITRHIPVGTDPNTMYLYVSHYTNSQCNSLLSALQEATESKLQTFCWVYFYLTCSKWLDWTMSSTIYPSFNLYICVIPILGEDITILETHTSSSIMVTKHVERNKNKIRTKPPRTVHIRQLLSV